VFDVGFQRFRGWLQWSKMSYLTLQRFTVSKYRGGGLQSENFHTFLLTIPDTCTKFVSHPSCCPSGPGCSGGQCEWIQGQCQNKNSFGKSNVSLFWI
jgi:hypothetical protein